MENLLIAKPEPGAELRRKLIVRTLRSIPRILDALGAPPD
jgi:hypothetical protein